MISVRMHGSITKRGMPSRFSIARGGPPLPLPIEETIPCQLAHLAVDIQASVGVYRVTSAGSRYKGA
jgi:hypothetical protein